MSTLGKRKRSESKRQQENRKAKKKIGSKEKRRLRWLGLKTDLRASWDNRLAKARPLMLVDVDITKIPTTTGGWRGVPRDDIEPRPPATLEGLKAANFTVLALEGKYDVPILDQNRRGIILYRPRDLSDRGIKRQDEQTDGLDDAAEKGVWRLKGRGPFNVGRKGHVHLGGTSVRIVPSSLLPNTHLPIRVQSTVDRRARRIQSC